MDFPDRENLSRMVDEKLVKLEKSQKELANEIGVNETTLSRNLSGDSTISYERARRIWDVLHKWEDERTMPASELMTDDIKVTYLTETRREAADKMLDGYLSQLPVREAEKGEVLGIVTDHDLMRNPDDEKLIGDIGYHHLIKVAPDTSRQLIEEILEEGHSAVLVVEEGEPMGIITTADLLVEGSLVEEAEG